MIFDGCKRSRARPDIRGVEAAISTPEPDKDLLERATHGDDAALEEVARRWHGRIRRWSLYEVGDPTLAEDVSQEALIRLIRSIGTYDPERPFAPWLRTLVRNCAKRLGGQDSRHSHDALAENQLTLVPRPEHDLDVGRRTERAISVFESLSARQREVMHLCTHDGLNAAEAARELGIAPATARVLLFRARRTIRTALLKELA